MKKSYHSIVVPIEDAAATFFSEVFGLTGETAEDRGAAFPGGVFMDCVKTNSSLVGFAGYRTSGEAGDRRRIYVD
jgi:hypothetical protein